VKNPPGYLSSKPSKKIVLIKGWPFWPLAFIPWAIGMFVIVKATIEALF